MAPWRQWSALHQLFLVLQFLIVVMAHTALASKGSGNDLHRHMSVEDVRQVFHVESHDQVPEYEVVPVHAVNKRSSGSDDESGHSLVAHLEAFGRPLQLALQRTTSLSAAGPPSALRMWAAERGGSAPDGVHLTEIPQAEHSEDIGHTYQDEQSGAALLVHRDPVDGTLIVEGTIGTDLIVRPLPASVRHLAPAPVYEQEGDMEEEGEDPNDDEMFLDDEGGQEEAVSTGFPLPASITDAKPRKFSKKASQFKEKKNVTKSRSKRSAASVGMHVIIKRSSPDVADPLSDYAFMEPDHIGKRFRERRDVAKSRDRREAPYVIYPEILVIVDYDGYRLHGGDNVQIKRYFVSFWNGVDLRYKLLKGPKVRISIAGIIISRGRDATPYLERNRVGRDAIDSAAALTDMGKYLFRERRLPVYDIAVAITKYDMCRRRKGGRCTKGTAGFAYVGGACVVNKRLEKVNSVAIIEDTGGFSGIIVAAHEVGHLLGAVHDGSPPPSYLGGPGAEKCRWEDGFIMSDLRHTEKGFRWSPCSVSSFHHFLNGDTATCLFNAPHEDDALPRVLPGKLLSLDAQCRKDRGTSACFKDERVCAQLFCFDANSGYCVAYRPAAEGSPCGDGQSCLNGRCVAEHENIIPDYTQITPAYARPGDQAAATQARPVYAEPPARNITTTRSRPPWSNLWSTSPTTPPPIYYSTSPYVPPSTTKYTTASPYTPWYSTTRYQYTTTTTKPPTSYFSYTNPTSKSTTYYSYTSATTKPPSKPTQYYNSYKSTTTYNNYNSYQSTTSTARPYYNNNNPYTQDVNVGGEGNADSCEDLPAKSPTSMPCPELLSRYPLQYCGSYYIKKHCCASMRKMCPAPYNTL